MKLIDFIDDFAEALKKQIAEDQKRWGDTWRHRPIEGQVERAQARFNDYHDQFVYGSMSSKYPWLKVAGEALIGWVRENNPDYYLGEKND